MPLSGKQWAVGEALKAEHRQDHNNLVGALNNRGLDVTLPPYNADPSNSATYNSDAFEAALADIEALDDDGNEGSTLFVPFGTFPMARSVYLRRGIILQGASGWGQGAGSHLQFDNDVTGIVVDSDNATGGAGEGAWSSIRDLGLLGGGSSGHGIDMWARASVSHVFIDGFGGNGVNIDSITSGGNLNHWSLGHVRIQNCGGHGVFTDGGDVNVGVALAVDVVNGGGWGFYDSSFLGNTYVACHTSNNAAGAYRVDGSSNETVLLGCYSEGNQPASNLEGSAGLVISGLHAAGFTSDTVAFLKASPGQAVQVAGQRFTVSPSGSDPSVEFNASINSAQLNLQGVDAGDTALIGFYPEGSLVHTIRSLSNRLQLGSSSLQLWSDRLQINLDLDHDGDGVGFYGTAPVAKPTVTGATDTDKIDSLISALASLGLITDSTT